jgi:hypothetical protein
MENVSPFISLGSLGAGDIFTLYVSQGNVINAMIQKFLAGKTAH